jgi:drug/metabolite transporter (DMT)-like permease
VPPAGRVSTRQQEEKLPERGGAHGHVGLTGKGLLGSPYLLLVLTMLFWGGNWIVGRAIREDIPPITLAFWRWAVALAVLLPFAWPHLRAQRQIIYREWKVLALLSLLGIAMFNTFIYLAVSRTTAINATLVNSIMPIAIVCTSWLLYRETVSLRQTAGIALSLLGVLGIITRGEPALLLELRFNPGDLFALATAPVWGFYSVLLRRRPEGLHALAFMAVLVGIGVVLLAPLYAWEVAAGLSMRLTPAAGMAIFYVGVFPSAVAYVFYNRGVALIGANRAGQFIHLVPVFGTLMAILFLGEALRPFHLAGILLIIAGIYLVTAGGKQAGAD